MKSKMLIILNTVALALNLMALDPNAPSTPTAANSGAKACCDHARPRIGGPHAAPRTPPAAAMMPSAAKVARL